MQIILQHILMIAKEWKSSSIFRFRWPWSDYRGEPHPPTPQKKNKRTLNKASQKAPLKTSLPFLHHFRPSNPWDLMTFCWWPHHQRQELPSPSSANDSLGERRLSDEWWVHEKPIYVIQMFDDLKPETMERSWWKMFFFSDFQLNTQSWRLPEKSFLRMHCFKVTPIYRNS